MNENSQLNFLLCIYLNQLNFKCETESYSKYQAIRFRITLSLLNFNILPKITSTRRSSWIKYLLTSSKIESDDRSPGGVSISALSNGKGDNR